VAAPAVVSESCQPSAEDAVHALGSDHRLVGPVEVAYAATEVDSPGLSTRTSTSGATAAT
jgi:hypothetical protein